MPPEPPPTTSRYRVSRTLIARGLLSLALRRQRSLAADGHALLRGKPTAVEGREHIPRSGPALFVMNHYERPGLGVWWPVVLATAVIGDCRGDRGPSWLVTDRFYRFRLGRVPLPQWVVGFVLRQIAALYDLQSIAREPREIAPRAVALRRLRRRLERGEAIASTPEGERAHAPRLGDPMPGAARSSAWLSRGRIPIVPVAVREDEAGRLLARFGRPYTLEWPGLRQARADNDRLEARLMGSLADLLPQSLRGEWRASGEAPSTDRPPS